MGRQYFWTSWRGFFSVKQQAIEVQVIAVLDFKHLHDRFLNLTKS